MSRKMKRMTAISSDGGSYGTRLRRLSVTTENKKRRGGFVVPALILLAVAFLLFKPVKTQKVERDPNLPEPKAEVIMPQYDEKLISSMAEMASDAKYIVSGVVVHRSDAVEKKITNSDGEKVTTLYTPVVIEIDEVVKGTIRGSSFVYMELGGMTADRKVEAYGVTPLYVDDSVFVFADKENCGQGNYSVFQILDGKITIDSSRLFENENGKTELSKEAFSKQIKDIIN